MAKREGKSSRKSDDKRIVGTSRTGKPVTKKQYVARKKREESGSQRKQDDLIRLNKYISNSGICSRRDADIYIKAGSVTVNGTPITEMGYKVKPTDEVKFDGQEITPIQKEYFVLNKPKGFITIPKGSKGTRTVMELMANASKAELMPVGHMERPSVGLLLITNDRELSTKLTDPKQPVRRLFHLELNRKFEPADLHKMREEGVMLKGKKIEIVDIDFVQGGRANEVGLEITDNSDKIVTRIFKSMGYEIQKLDRVIYGPLTKKDLPRGHYRILSKQEVNLLKMM
jgi:23S rRNA pseudouridine2605 synthase